MSLLVSVLTSHFLGDDGQAEQFSQSALALVDKIGSQFLRGLALKDRGFLLANQQKFQEAETAYQASLECLAQTEQVLESRAGLAWLTLGDGMETAVKTQITPVVEHLKQGGTLDGTSRPLYVMLLTYKVLCRLDDPYAGAVLETAYGRLVAWANQITNAKRRSSFLENVPFNREIALLHESQ